MANAIGAANEGKAANTTGAASPSDTLGSLAMATTVAAMMSSMPAALHLITHASLSTGRDKPGGAAQAVPQDADAQITRRVASPGGSAGAGTQAGSSSTGQRGGSSSGDGFAGDADGPEAPPGAADVARAQPQFADIAPLAVATANANADPVVGSVAAAQVAPTRDASGAGAQALQVLEQAPRAAPSMLSGLGVRQAIALFKQNTTAIRIPMSVVAIVA